MWLITRDGFFNIVQSDDDREKGLLTVKARKIEDLERFKQIVNGNVASPIQTSYANDYHFRIKSDKKAVVEGVAIMVSAIEYSKTKPVLHKSRSGIYFQVWETLADLQKDNY